MSKRPKLAYHQRTAANNNDREETSSVVEYEYTGRQAPRNVTHVRIPSTVTKIERLVRMHLIIAQHCRVSTFHPSTVTKIDYNAFSECSSLNEIVLSEGLTSIGSSAFQECSSLQSITIPSTVDEISMTAFIRCNSLRGVVLSDGLKKIESYAFQECTSLQSITIPSTVDEIGEEAFYSCTNLRDVVLNEGIKRIKVYTFAKCTSLRSVELPSNIIEIERFAFRDCTELREVVIHNEEVQIDDKAFNKCTSLERFKFPRLSTRLGNIIQAGQRNIEAKMDDTAVEWRGGELVIPSMRRQVDQNEWGVPATLVIADKGKLGKVKELINYYDIKEATTIFELALWKSKINQAEGDSADRGVCRVEVPGPVKDTILQYL